MKGKFFVSILIVLLLPYVVSGSTYVYISGENLKVGQTNQYDIVLEEAPDGLSNYGITLFLPTDSAQVVEVTSPEWTTVTESIKTSNSIWLEASDVKDNVKPNSSDITLAMVKLRGISEGSELLKLKIVYLYDDNDSTIDYIEGSQFIKVETVTIGGEYQPNDLDSDSLYEDVNGDSSFNFGDITNFFEVFGSIASENKPYFDFNGDNSVNFGDVVKLFNML